MIQNFLDLHPVQAARPQEGFKILELVEAVDLGISVNEVFNAYSFSSQAVGILVYLEKIADGIDEIVNGRGEIELLVFLVMGLPDLELSPIR